MARKLVVCCDGTWNTPRTDTNIFRTYQFLRESLGSPLEKAPQSGVVTCSGSAADGSEVLLFYDEGVGAEWFSRIVGGGVGVGLSDNVRDAYRFLGEHFTPGSEIYLFGFSRGAYTVRSLCGFIKAAGLLDRPTVRDVWRAYMDLYATESAIATRPGGWSADRARAWLVEKAGDAVGRVGGADVASLPRHADVKIRFIGVYDTVGSLGVPLAGATRVNEPIVGFHDTSIGDKVEHAVQALAVDEKRGPFVPTLWTLAAGAALPRAHTVLQVWFPGVHSDIGGGYGDKAIGNITWDFMMREASKRGLVIDPARPTPSVRLDPLPAQHESFDADWRLLSKRLHILPMGVRTIGPTVLGPSGEILTAAGDVRLHPSLIGRFGKRCTTILDEGRGLTQEGLYEPGNVKADTLPSFS